MKRSLLLAAADPAAPSSIYALQQDDLLQAHLYPHIRHIVTGIAEDGAIKPNDQWEKGAADKWFIEQQRYGGDLLQDGVFLNDPALKDLGLKVLSWGFGKQGPDGSFPGTGDPFHSTSFFVEASARAMLILRDSNQAGVQDTVSQYLPKVLAAAHWLTQKDVQSRGRSNNKPYTHRRWLLAAALGEAAALGDDRDLARVSESYVREGLSLQQADGVNPEKGGGDVNYQAVGILMAERAYEACRSGELKAQILQMIQKGLDWELAHIGADGEVNMEGSTRVGVETGRSGKVKKVDYEAVLQALAFGAKLTGKGNYLDTARLVARHQGW